MSTEHPPLCTLSPSNSASSATFSDESEHTPLYRSLECLKHPSCVSTTWIDAISEVNNPRALNHVPYKDGSLHWVDNDNQLLNMAFPAVLDLEGRFSKIGPYFNHMGEHEARVSIFKILIFSSLVLLHYYLIETIHRQPRQNQSRLSIFSLIGSFCQRSSN
jgi:hypothetical protein